MVEAKAAIKFPENDSANSIFNLIFALPAIQSLHVAHHLNLFGVIAENSGMTFRDIATEFQMNERPAQALLSMCASLGLIRLDEQNKFQLTEVSRNYLLKESPFYAGGALDMTRINAEVYSFDSLKTALFKNTSQVYNGKELFETNEQQIELARIFTHAMHGKSMATAGLWPNKLDLSQNHCLLDIGGGSAAHSIAAVSHWPNLKAIVFETPVICDISKGYIEQFQLTDRIGTHVGDMWKDSFPKADLHFYSDIFHDWSFKQCLLLVQKSFAELEPKGRIIIHEMLFNEDKTGPLSVASYNTMMLLWTQTGQQFSKKELTALLQEGGFQDIEIIPTGFGDWSIITGIKP